MIKQVLFGSIALLATAGVQAVTLVGSRFDAGAEGWLALNGVVRQGWQPTGGNPGGYFEASDVGGGQVWVFHAPAAYRGNQLAALGGSLSFELKVTTVAFPMANDWGDVKIGGGGLELVIDAGPSPGLDWTPYSVTLAPGGWRLGNVAGPLATAADFATVLANVDFLRIRGEYSAVLDRGGLDNVVLATAVPEPATSLLWLSGLAVLSGAARRRRR